MIAQYKLIVLTIPVVMNVHVKRDISVMENFALMIRDPRSLFGEISIGSSVNGSLLKIMNVSMVEVDVILMQNVLIMKAVFDVNVALVFMVMDLCVKILTNVLWVYQSVVQWLLASKHAVDMNVFASKSRIQHLM